MTKSARFPDYGYSHYYPGQECGHPYGIGVVQYPDGYSPLFCANTGPDEKLTSEKTEGNSSLDACRTVIPPIVQPVSILLKGN